MRALFAVLMPAALLVACGQGDSAGNQPAKATQPKKKKAAHCFFKDAEMRAWAAKRDKDGNIVLTGQAFRSDSRYKAVLGPPEAAGGMASVAPTITVNDTGYAAVDNWWDLKATLADSAALEGVNVTCGAKTVATIKLPPVPPKKTAG